MSKPKSKKKAAEECDLGAAKRLTGEDVSSKQNKEIKAAFDAMDLNHNGRLTVTEIRQACKKLKILFTRDEMEQLIQKHDVDGNGSVDFKEFAEIVSHQLVIANYKTGFMKKVFEQFDVDGDGYITRDEIRDVFKKTGVDLSEEEINELVEEADENKDGVISFEEFVQTVCETDW